MTALLQAFSDEEGPARRLAQALGIQAAIVDVHRFPDGEILPRVPKCADTTVVYRSLNHPNDKIIELVLAAEAWRRNGVRRLVLVAPYLCYMRQDKAFSAGEPISQRAIGRLLGGLFDRVITVDAHLHRTPTLAEVFPGRECVNLRGAGAIAGFFRTRGVPPGLVVVGPDAESRQWAEAVAGSLDAVCAVLTKERRDDAHVVLHPPAALFVSGKPVLIVDDVASSGATLIQASRLLSAAGASSLMIAVTHALFDAAVTETLRSLGVTEIFSGDSCLHATNAIPLAPILAEALRSETMR